APWISRETLRLRWGKPRDWDASAPLPRPRRVDDRERAEALLVRVDARIERAAPRARDDVDRFRRLAAGAHRPEDLLEIHNVDVVVDDDGVATQVRAGMHARRRVTDLPRVTGVPLADLDRVEETRAADLV